MRKPTPGAFRWAATKASNRASSPASRGWPPTAFRHVGKGTFCLLQREQPKLEEAMAGDGCQEVGIAATGVEHHPIGVTGGQAHQLVLELERAELRQLGVIDSRHGTPPIRCELRSVAQGRSEACVCRKVRLIPGRFFHVRFVVSRSGQQAGQLKVSYCPGASGPPCQSARRSAVPKNEVSWHELGKV